MKTEKSFSFERCVIIEEDKVIKRELREKELLLDPNGEPIQPYWYKERLLNEAATLDFIASYTRIPVPRFQLYTEDGLLHLETERIKDGVLLMDIDPSSQEIAFATVGRQINSEILPQLRSFYRNVIGSVDSSIPVFPPSRVYGLDRRAWERVKAKGDEYFVLCHNDLGPQNIFIHPTNFSIVGIIDWEFSGFFPESYELPLWTTMNWEVKSRMCAQALSRELSLFGLKPENLEQ